MRSSHRKCVLPQLPTRWSSTRTERLRRPFCQARPAKHRPQEHRADEQTADASRKAQVPGMLVSAVSNPLDFRHHVAVWWGKLLYSYFNWRKDTWNDLQLFMLLNILLLAIGATCRAGLQFAFTEELPEEGVAAAWQSIYEVLVVVFGQDLPDIAASATAQLFSCVVALVGLLSFALVLSLVEQVVLQVLDTNVRQGGKVYESGHTLILSLTDSQRDQEVIWKIISQACLAHRGESNPHCIVVLCQKEKLFMEAAFRRSLPEKKRYGCRFVFRQGLPLIPESLQQVSAPQAAATIVISDSSRSPEEADAQAVRVAVLLDELDFPGFDKPDPRTGHIIVEVKTPDAKELIEYSCSKRVIALPTGVYNAKRIATLVCQPVVGMVSQQLWSFHSESQCYLQPATNLAGRRLSEVHRRFTRGLVLGVYNNVTRRTVLNPPVSQKLKSNDSLVMFRPTAVAKGEYKPMSEAVAVDMGDWSPTRYVYSTEEDPVAVMKSHDEAKLAGLSAKVCRPSNGKLPPNCTGLYLLPLEYTTTSNAAERVLICGWGNSIFMLDLLRALDDTLPIGSQVTLFNLRVNDAVLGAVRSEAELQNIQVMGVRGDPLKINQLRRRIDVIDYKCAIVLCDEAWQDPDLDLSNGLDLVSEADTLRLDALVMTVQLNIRKLLEEAGFPDINLIAEKVAFEGVTRFEDRKRLPMGISVNFTAYAAKMCFQAAYNPTILGPYMQFSNSAELIVQDASAFCKDGEEINFWQLQGRCLSVGQTLIGSYEIPSTVDSPLSLAVNPWGLEERNRKFAWNRGNGRRKILTLVDKYSPQSSLGRRSKTTRRDTLQRLLADASKAGKVEMGYFDLGLQQNKEDNTGEITWIPQTGASIPQNVTRPTSWTLQEHPEDVWKCSSDANGRLLDDLSSKTDYALKFQEQQRAARQN